MSPRLSDGELDLRYVFLDEAGETELTALLPQLDETERTQTKRLLLLTDKIAFAAGRALIRTMLSAHALCPAEGWCLERDKYGKPRLTAGSGFPDLRFNISHSSGAVIAAMSLGRDIGVDVESKKLQIDHLELARAYFAAAEIELIEALPEARQRDAFFALWTLKEAYVKAQGKGLSIPLSAFTVTLNPPNIAFSSESLERPEQWFLRQGHLSSSHEFAIAARRCEGEKLVCSMSVLRLAELSEQTR